MGPPKLPFLNDIKMLKKADPVPLAAPSLELGHVNEEEQRWSVEDRHLGHIEKRPQLGKLPFLAQIKSLRPPSPTMPSQRPNPSESNEKTRQNLSPQSVSSPGLALVQAMKEICVVSDAKPMQALAPAQVSKLTLAPCRTPVVASQSVGQAPPPPPPPPPQGWNPKCSLPKHTSAPAPMSQVDVTTVRRVESNSASSQNFPALPLQPTQQNSRSSIVADSTKKPSSPKPVKAKKCQKNVIKLDEHSTMGKLADQIIPQLNHMQKNFLGLLFFNE